MQCFVYKTIYTYTHKTFQNDFLHTQSIGAPCESVSLWTDRVYAGFLSQSGLWDIINLMHVKSNKKNIKKLLFEPNVGYLWQYIEG